MRMKLPIIGGPLDGEKFETGTLPRFRAKIALYVPLEGWFEYFLSPDPCGPFFCWLFDKKLDNTKPEPETAPEPK